jgi:hypothetical protein
MTNHNKPSDALRSLRARNRSLVIDVLRHEGSASRAEIARRTGLSRATIFSLVADLKREGLVVEGRTGPAQPGAQGGRPGVLLSLERPPASTSPATTWTWRSPTSPRASSPTAGATGSYALPAAVQAVSVAAGAVGERAALLGALALVISKTTHQPTTTG